MAWPLLLLLMLGEARGRFAPTEPPPRREATFIRSAISGGAAAAAATVVFHPVDTMKTVLQQRGGGWRTLRALGLRELYTGVVPAAFSMMPACAVRMGVYEVLKATLLLQAAALSPGASITLASALSVVASSSVRAPLDMVKTQVQTGAAGSVGEALRIAWGRGGMAGLYLGAGLALLRDVPFFSINLLLYEKLKAAAVAKAAAAAAAEGAVPSDDVSGRDAIFIGAAAQGCAGLLTNPMDALKTQVQAGSAGGVRAAYGGLMARAGPIGFMRGAGARVIWIAPQGCVYYPVYEAVQKILTPK